MKDMNAFLEGRSLAIRFAVEKNNRIRRMERMGVGSWKGLVDPGRKSDGLRFHVRIIAQIKRER
jgi:hypothetical protein